MGFSIPIAEWIKKEWKSDFYDVLLQKQTDIPIDYKFVNRILDEHCSSKRNHVHKIWTLYIFHKWIAEN